MHSVTSTAESYCCKVRVRGRKGKLYSSVQYITAQYSAVLY
jgi:hypothetical protein